MKKKEIQVTEIAYEILLKIPPNVFQCLFVKVTTREYNKIKHFRVLPCRLLKLNSSWRKFTAFEGSPYCSSASRIPLRTLQLISCCPSLISWGEDLRKWVKTLQATSSGCQQQQQNPSPQQHQCIKVLWGKPQNTWHLPPQNLLESKLLCCEW